MGWSPSWRCSLLRSTVRMSTRAGVPVLKRRSSKPSSARLALSPLAGNSPEGPWSSMVSPMMIRDLR